MAELGCALNDCTVCHCSQLECWPSSCWQMCRCFRTVAQRHDRVELLCSAVCCLAILCPQLRLTAETDASELIGEI